MLVRGIEAVEHHLLGAQLQLAALQFVTGPPRFGEGAVGRIAFLEPVTGHQVQGGVVTGQCLADLAVSGIGLAQLGQHQGIALHGICNHRPDIHGLAGHRKSGGADCRTDQDSLAILGERMGQFEHG